MAHCANRQAEDGRLRQFGEGPFCGTSGAVAPAVPRYFTLEIVSFRSGQCTIRVTYW